MLSLTRPSLSPHHHRRSQSWPPSPRTAPLIHISQYRQTHHSNPARHSLRRPYLSHTQYHPTKPVSSLSKSHPSPRRTRSSPPLEDIDEDPFAHFLSPVTDDEAAHNPFFWDHHVNGGGDEDEAVGGSGSGNRNGNGNGNRRMAFSAGILVADEESGCEDSGVMMGSSSSNSNSNINNKSTLRARLSRRWNRYVGRLQQRTEGSPTTTTTTTTDDDVSSTTTKANRKGKGKKRAASSDHPDDDETAADEGYASAADLALDLSSASAMDMDSDNSVDPPPHGGDRGPYRRPAPYNTIVRVPSHSPDESGATTTTNDAGYAYAYGYVSGIGSLGRISQPTTTTNLSIDAATAIPFNPLASNPITTASTRPTSLKRRKHRHSWRAPDFDIFTVPEEGEVGAAEFGRWGWD
ncbi:hypothetical protein K490DRAFT_59197 [Saccharata proteae CBS 121410]|uniref:Uncharacterized protein n=1 Tax=Saccharata proteae CBS 121410 TaxID=1314787 RepID=A0A9P4HSK3_9PEZI|nr:hypothetical protein K490DRAFT_59197 [Saccharata proteae CBS 121410]